VSLTLFVKPTTL